MNDDAIKRGRDKILKFTAGQIVRDGGDRGA
jgi:hypothetical protein